MGFLYMNVSCVCGHCRRVVDYGEGLFDDEIWYHERCYFIKLKKEVESLEKKARNKSITLEEYERLQEICPLLDNIRTSAREPKQKLSDVLGSCHTPKFEGSSEGMLKLKSYKLELIEHKKLLVLAENKNKLLE